MPAEPRQSLWAELRDGWRPGLGSVLAMATGLSLVTLTAGYFVRPLGEAFGWTRGQIALSSAFGLLGTVATPIAGWLSDRLGVRVVGSIGLAMLACGLVALSFINGMIWQYYAAIAFVQVAGSAASAIVLSRPLAHAFNVNRGAALGIGMGITGVLTMVFSPSLQAIITYQGWRAGYLFLAALCIVVGMAAILLFVPNERATATAPLASPSERTADLLRALRTHRFWLLFVAMLLANLCFGGLLHQLPALLGDRGLDPISVGFVMSLLSASAIVGRLIEGFAVDRFWPPLVAATTMLIPTAGLVLLMDHNGDMTRSVIAVLLLGSVMGAESTILAYFTARYFGLRAYSAVYGVLAIAIGISLASGGAMFGLVYDRTGAYDVALLVAAVGLVVAAMCILATGVGDKAANQRATVAAAAASQNPS